MNNFFLTGFKIGGSLGSLAGGALTGSAYAMLITHDIAMHDKHVRECIEYAVEWEKVRTPQRWQNMSQYHRNKVIRGWIYKRRRPQIITLTK